MLFSRNGKHQKWKALGKGFCDSGLPFDLGLIIFSFLYEDICEIRKRRKEIFYNTI